MVILIHANENELKRDPYLWYDLPLGLPVSQDERQTDSRCHPINGSVSKVVEPGANRRTDLQW